LLDDIRMTLLEAGSPLPRAHYQTGDRLPFGERPLHYPEFVFPLELEPGKDYVLVLRVATSSAMQVPLTLWTPGAHASHRFTKGVLFGGVIGMIFIMALYNLFLWVSIRETSYLFGALCVGGYSLIQGCLTGVAYRYLWPNQPEWNQVSLLVVTGIAIV